ncbi:hypothetical protein ACFW2V_12885 [Streptomyces sp. NPDC058947]|uniref:hypothetical protein n=1 Tax=Streptomyces sp. NPDC058947 TaxID=3346675 RepID=UPI0036903AB0
MSDDIQQTDPWADEIPAPADADDIVWGEGEDDPFGDILDEVDLEETESGEAIRVRDDASKKYDDPRDVGLVDGMWVPVRILASEVQEKHVPRLSAKTCIAKGQIKDPKTGEMKKGTFVLFDQVEEALKNGGTETIGEVPLPYFVCTANHAAPRFGQRRWDWEIEVPVFTIKTALYKAQRNRTGYKNDNGRSLRIATGATATGDKVSKANMHEVAGKMVDAIVLAQVSVVQAKRAKFRDRLDADGKQILVAMNPETGDPVTVFRHEDGSGYVDEVTGEVWEGNEELLVHVEGNRYAIRDTGDLSGPLTEEYLPFNDYINPPFLPLPERKVKVERVQGGDEPVYDEGEITLDTIGAIARGNGHGAQVDILLRTGKDAGKTITATWFGTEWVEVAAPKDGESSGMETFQGSEEQAQEAALASM